MKGLIFSDSFLESRLIMIRVIGAPWPEADHEHECHEALERWNAHRTRKPINVRNVCASTS